MFLGPSVHVWSGILLSEEVLFRVPLSLRSGGGGLLERMAACSPDIISLDQSVDLVDGIKRCGSSFAYQVGAMCVCLCFTRSVSECGQLQHVVPSHAKERALLDAPV